MKIAILAGGAGTRLWPQSRESRPKQLLALSGDKTMIRETVDRVRPLVSPDDIYVVTAARYLRPTAAQLPDLPRANLIGEPCGRGSAAAIGLAVIQVADDPGCVVASLHSDHFIARPEAFRAALVAAAEVAKEGYLVTLGIKPTSPHTGLGYIQRGAPLGEYHGHTVYRLNRFVEKPDQATAAAYLASGEYDWNGGYFIGLARTFLEEFARHMPELANTLFTLQAARGSRAYKSLLAQLWPKLANVPIDYGIMEKTDRGAVIPVDIGWSDIGDWSVLATLLPGDSAGNVVQGDHLGLDTEGCLIYSNKRLVATIGLRDLVIVDTGDALLICPKSRSQEVKRVVEQLKEKNKLQYL